MCRIKQVKCRIVGVKGVLAIESVVIYNLCEVIVEVIVVVAGWR